MAIDYDAINRAAFLRNARKKREARTVLNSVLAAAEPKEREQIRRFFASQRDALAEKS